MKSVRQRHLLEEHYLDFYGRALAILDDEDDAKDAVQEAVVRTLVRLGVHDVVAYCFRATERESINILRRRRRVTLLEGLPEVSADDNALGRELREVRGLLLPMERHVLELRHDHGYTVDEVAARMGVSPSTVKRLTAHAEKKLKYIMTHEV